MLSRMQRLDISRCALVCQQNFSMNFIGPRGAEALGEALSTNASLVRLNFDSCSIADKGGEAIARGLESVLSLRWLNLANNRLGVHTADALCTVLQVRLLALCLRAWAWARDPSHGARVRGESRLIDGVCRRIRGRRW